jgi:hypothetical protein
MGKMKLSAENVHHIFMDCLFNDDEEKKDPVVAEGITLSVGFNPVRLKKNEESIYGMLKELPASFQKDSGGGMSFLQACEDKDGNQWTGMHQTMQELFLLGLAAGKVQYCLPKELWSALPGGVPYLTVL